MSLYRASILEPFDRYYEHRNRCFDLLHMLCDAAYFVQARPSLIETCREEWGEEMTNRELARAEHNARIAATEVDAGHPLIHAQAVVILWGGLEAMVMDFLAAWLAINGKVRELEVVKGIKISFGEYEALSEEERATYLLDKVEEKCGSRRAGGIQRFEVLFRLFDLGSPIDPTVIRNLLELNAVRNLLVHKRGFVDARFKAQCPWINVEIGSEITISHDDYHRYYDAADLYVFEITCPS